MRNEVVVLVLLYCEVASEFISPLGDVEHDVMRNAPAIRKRNKKDVNMTTAISEPGVELNNSNIDKDLYENGAPQKNQSERAFIYINHKFRKFKFLHPDTHKHSKPAQTKPMSHFQPQHVIQPNISSLTNPCKCNSKDTNSYFIEHDGHFKILDMKSYLAPSNCKGKNMLENKMKHNDETVRNRSRNEQETYGNNEFSKFSSSTAIYSNDLVPGLSPLNYAYFDKLRQIRQSHYDVSKLLVPETNFKLRSTQGPNSPYVQHRDQQFNVQVKKNEESLNIRDLLTGDFNLEKETDDIESLDKYLAELEEHATREEKTILVKDSNNENAIAEERNASTPGKKGVKSGKSLNCTC